MNKLGIVGKGFPELEGKRREVGDGSKVMEQTGWNMMESHGRLWKVMEPTRIMSWNLREPHGTRWKAMELSGIQ